MTTDFETIQGYYNCEPAILYIEKVAEDAVCGEVVWETTRKYIELVITGEEIEWEDIDTTLWSWETCDTGRDPEQVCLWDGSTVDGDGNPVVVHGFIDYDTSTNPSTPIYVLFSDPTTPVTGYEVVDCGEEERDKVEHCQQVLVSGPGYSIGDEIAVFVFTPENDRTLPIDGYSVYYNYTTRTYFEPADPSHIGQCVDACDPATVSYYADAPNVISYNQYSVTNPTCCDIIVDTGVGINIVQKGMSYNSPIFNCTLDTNVIAIVNPGGLLCDLSEILVTLNRVK